jgi:predicted enzyme related to lactoylglutathione lyase
MIKITHALLWVLDQDEALAFYTEKLGWEVRADVTVFLSSDDVQAAYEELTARGVQFVGPLEERPYGLDSSFRDPSGNHLRLMQLRQPPEM